jgi:hypothetical protein
LPHLCSGRGPARSPSPRCCRAGRRRPRCTQVCYDAPFTWRTLKSAAPRPRCTQVCYAARGESLPTWHSTCHAGRVGIAEASEVGRVASAMWGGSPLPCHGVLCHAGRVAAMRAAMRVSSLRHDAKWYAPYHYGMRHTIDSDARRDARIFATRRAMAWQSSNAGSKRRLGVAPLSSVAPIVPGARRDARLFAVWWQMPEAWWWVVCRAGLWRGAWCGRCRCTRDGVAELKRATPPCDAPRAAPRDAPRDAPLSAEYRRAPSRDLKRGHGKSSMRCSALEPRSAHSARCVSSAWVSAAPIVRGACPVPGRVWRP